MANYSKFLSLISGADRTVDLSNPSNNLELGGSLQMDGSTSGHVVINASATTVTYAMIWPTAQAASSGYVLTNDGTGVLSWAAPAATGVTAISIASSNGFAGTSSGGSTPILTISTTLTTPVVAANGTALIAGTTTGTGSTVVLSAGPTFTGTVTAAALTLSSALVVASGGTGNTSFTAYAPIAGGTTSTGPLQSLSSGMSTSGYVLTSTGASSAPTWQASFSLPPPLEALGTYTSDYTGSPSTFLGNNSDLDQTNLAIVLGSTDTAIAGNNTSNVVLVSGDQTNAASTGNTGGVFISAGNIVDGAGTAGPVHINAGSVDAGSGAPGDLLVQAGSFSGGTSLGTGGGLLQLAAGGTNDTVGTGGNVNVIAGNATGATGIGGSIILTPGTGNTTKGKIRFNDLSGAITSGEVWTSTNSSGDGHWATPSTSGTVTSVAFADASTTPIYGISGSPVTSSGTLTQTLTTQSANTVFAGPSSGSAAQPTFRALVSADIPSLSATYVTQSEVGAASGVAPLDGSSKIPASFLPSVVMEYQGAWNPNTNTPALADGTGTNGFVYRVSALDLGTVAGLTDPSMTNFQVGNLVIYSGTLGQWQQAPSADGVTFVNGAQGAIVSTVASANGFTGSYSANVLTMATSVTGILQGNGTAISAATTTGTGSVVQSASPTLTGTVLATNVTLSGALVAPTTEMTAVYGGATTLTANTTYVMRWGMPSNGETAGRLYVADWNTASFDLFWAVGLFSSASSVPTGTTITVVTEGTLTLGSSDTTFGSSDQGRPVYLGSAGAFVPYSTFAPASGDANTKVGIAQTASTIFVSIQVMGVS